MYSLEDVDRSNNILNLGIVNLTLGASRLEGAGITIDSTLPSGAVHSVNVCMTNTGTQAAVGPIVNGLLLSKDDEPGQDYSFGTYTYEGSVLVGETVCNTVDIRLIFGTTPLGNFFFIHDLDVKGFIYQIPHVNGSTSYEAIPVEVVPPANADIEVVNVEHIPNLAVGENFTIDITMKNVGLEGGTGELCQRL